MNQLRYILEIGYYYEEQPFMGPDNNFWGKSYFIFDRHLKQYIDKNKVVIVNVVKDQPEEFKNPHFTIMSSSLIMDCEELNDENQEYDEAILDYYIK